MARKNDDSPDPKNWTNRKLVATVRPVVFGETGVLTAADYDRAERALDEIERRFVRSSSRN